MNNLKNERGLTLLELLAALAIFSLIGVIMFSIVLNALKTFDDGMVHSQLVKETEMIEMRIKNTARNTTTVSVSEESENAYIFNSSALSTPNVVFMYDVDNSKLLFFSEDPFDDDGDPKTLEEQSLGAMVLSNKVEEFELTISEDNKQIVYSIVLVEDDQSVEVSGSGSVFIPNWR